MAASVIFVHPHHATGDSRSAIIGGVTGAALAVLVTILIVIIIVTILLVMRAKQGFNHHGNHPENVNEQSTDYERPLPPPLESIPPNVQLEMNPAYEQYKDFNLADNSAYDNYYY